ncbi:3-oxoacyl-ACP reductase [Pantoea dispersa]|uniref:SDR family NAD(P)-dependent oxidoreductase n=1 Tax=Pantoea dispersa TaxID=59814 RepID=UPI0007362A48|nr:SDR family NAD(P)-dependent oxidoreductase [Pantoea dispersa]KTS17255.1 3-oxoacyl-ACP reductase [Pantoea dispersa]KTS88787.1 3-oxoacyl-ACP reductase [Pantoea dispersa]
MDLKLDGKIALITGSTKGIGEAVARGLAVEGTRVIIHGRDPAKAENIASDIINQGGQAYAVTGDLTREADIQLLYQQVCSLVQSVDIVVNNAGGSGPTEDWTSSLPETWAAGYDKNVLSALRVINLFLPGMREQKWGRIINISSLAALMPPARRPDYAAAKAGIIAMTSSLAKAVAHDGVTVNTLSPGTIHSASLEKAFRQTAKDAGLSADAPWEDIEQAVLPLYANVPMARVGTLKEIEDAITFLASPLSGYITGSNLRLDGGMWPGL